MSQTKVETHSARKHHRCDWCWQSIEAGETYRRYRYYFNSGDAMTVRAHLECYDAIIDAAVEEGGSIEWTPGQERPERVADFPEEK